MKSPLRIAIAGLGTVGAGTVALLQAHGEALVQKCGRPLVVTAVSARDKSRDRGVDFSGAAWFDDAVAMAGEAEADVIVELVGGEDGVAKAICEAAIAVGRPVVTANKALLALHGTKLARAAEAAGVTIGYEGRCRRRHPDRQSDARRVGRQRDFTRLRNSERHVQLYSERDAPDRAAVRRSAGRSASARLRRGRTVCRC